MSTDISFNHRYHDLMYLQAPSVQDPGKILDENKSSSGFRLLNN